MVQANQRYSQLLAETLGRLSFQATGSSYRGSFPSDLFVLCYARVPAVLVEIGFGNHPVEGWLPSDGAYWQKRDPPAVGAQYTSGDIECLWWGLCLVSASSLPLDG